MTVPQKAEITKEYGLDRIDSLRQEEKTYSRSLQKKIGADQEYLNQGNRRIDEKFGDILQKIDIEDFSKIDRRLSQNIYKENYNSIGENLTNTLLNTSNISGIILKSIKNQIFPVNEEKRAVSKRVKAELKENLSESLSNFNIGFSF